MIYNVLTNDGDNSPLIPVTDGYYYTIDMTETDEFLARNFGDFVISFFDADGVTPITPTAGTIVPVMAPVEGQFMAPGSGDTEIDATTVICSTDGIATYTLPVFNGGAKQGRITLSGITGATYAKAEFRRFN